MKIWCRINKDYYSKEYDDKALTVSDPVGKDLQNAVEQYYKELAKNEKCLDDTTQQIRIDLTVYICLDNESIGTPHILIKNY
jgi:hypothetical protein